MKHKIEKISCDKCTDSRLYPITKIYKMSYRYNDKQRHYRNSKSKIIHSGYAYVCVKHLKELIKFMQN